MAVPCGCAAALRIAIVHPPAIASQANALRRGIDMGSGRGFLVADLHQGRARQQAGDVSGELRPARRVDGLLDHLEIDEGAVDGDVGEADPVADEERPRDLPFEIVEYRRVAT